MEQIITIDLTNSFTLVDHCELDNTIIDLVEDDSFNFSTDFTVVNNDLVTSKQIGAPNNKQASSTLKCKEQKKTYEFGDCPICWDQLGKKSLASTKCGHVFCFSCLEKALKVEKKCPTCRHTLTGKSAYHPLYLHS